MIKQFYKIWCLLCCAYYCQAQQDSTQVQKAQQEPKLLIGTNLSMPFFTVAYGGYGAAVSGIYFFSKNFGVNAGAGIANYADLGQKDTEYYESKGHHFTVGLNWREKIEQTALKYVAYVGNINFIQSQTKETGYWQASNWSADSYGYWGIKGYPFEAARLFYGVEVGTGVLASIYKRHSLLFKGVVTAYHYDDNTYFKASATSGIGYLPFNNNRSFTIGIQIWYYFQLY
jgi:hypothetical protein